MEVDRPILIATLLFAMLISIFYLVIPKYNAFQEVLTKVGQKEADFQSKAAYYIEVTSVYKELLLYQDVLNKIDTALPSKFSLASIVNFLYKATAANGIILQKIATNKSTEPSITTNIKETTLSVSIVGSYPSLEKFITSLEKSARLIEGESVSFSVEVPSIIKPNISPTNPIDMTIKVYSYQAPITK